MTEFFDRQYGGRRPGEIDEDDAGEESAGVETESPVLNTSTWHPLKLFDTLRSRSLEFPDHPNHRVGIYVCGGTVHGSPHLGHLRSAVTIDVLRRWLIHTGYDVLLVRNVTDIDDKILAKSRQAGRPWWEWAATYEREFSEAYDLVRCLPASVEPRATGHMTEMIELIERLVAAGHAYHAAPTQDVYFEVASWPGYGALSHQDPALLGQDDSAQVPGSDPRGTSPSGKRPSRTNRAGRARGVGGGRAGTWNVRRCPPAIWGRRSISTQAAAT